MNREVAVSKALSKLLRHAAEDAGLKLDAEGFANLESVVSTPLSVYENIPVRECKLESLLRHRGWDLSRVSKMFLPHISQ